MFESKSYRMTHALMRHTSVPGTTGSSTTFMTAEKEKSVTERNKIVRLTATVKPGKFPR